MLTLLKRILIGITILVILGLLGRMVPDPPKSQSARETREEGVQRISAEYGYSDAEVRRAMQKFERSRP